MFYRQDFFTALKLLVVSTFLCGVLYPLGVYVVTRVVFTKEADGSLISQDGRVVGSELLAQKNGKPGYFKSRPSAADFQTVASGASQAGPTSMGLSDAVNKRLADDDLGHLPVGERTVYVDLLTASGSGLDPHLSAKSLKLQIPRIVRERNWDHSFEEKISRLIDDAEEQPQFGLLGRPRVNVLMLNLALAKLE